jgi:uncharacterized protein involved in exopolysaccharide biosynthesis
MNLSQFLAILVARRWMIIAAVLASLAGAAVVVILVPPRYTATTRVLLDIIKPDPVTGQIIGGQFARAYTQTQTQLIKDYSVAGEVVDDLGWSQDPTLLARYAVASDPNGARHRLAQIIIDHTDAKLVEGSNILEISYTGWSPGTARRVTDAIRKAYMSAAVQTKRESAAESANWYQTQAAKSQRLLSIAENAKTKFEREHGLIMEDEKTDIDTQRLSALSGAAAASSAVPTASMGASASAAATELATVDAQLAQASRTLGPGNPIFVQLQAKRNLLATQVAQEHAAAGAANSAARATGGAANTELRQLEAQKSRVLANRDNLATLRQLQTEVDLRREQFAKTSQAAADLRTQSVTDDAGVTVLSNAVAPEKPSFPNLPLIMFGSVGLGFALGMLAALLTELLNRRIRTARDLQDVNEGIPLLAVVGSATAPGNKRWLKLAGLRRRRRPEALAA